VIVPLIAVWLLRQAPTRAALLGAALSILGLALLTLGQNLTPAYGDLIVLGCAFCFALHIVLVSAFAPHTDAFALTIVQVLTVALLSGVASLGFEGRPGNIPVEIWLATGFTGVLATALAFGVQNRMQAHTTATHTALILATEPVFAALFGYLLGGDRLARSGIVGCGLILLGMLLSMIIPPPASEDLRIQTEKEYRT